MIVKVRGVHSRQWNSKCKGSEAGAHVAHWKNGKKGSVAEEETVKQRVLPGGQGGWSPDHKEVSKPQGKVWLLFYMGWEATVGSLQGSDMPWFPPLYAEWIVRDKNKSRERADTGRDKGEGGANIF